MGGLKPSIVLFNNRGDLIHTLLTPLSSLIFGACCGSFLNVCLFRWKNGGHVLYPPSFCPCCKKNIKWYDNIPVLSFIWLRGKCRSCSHSISFQYPTVEAATAILFCLAAQMFGNDKPLAIVESYFFLSFLVLFVVSDLKWRLLPHVFNNFFILFGLFFMALESSPKLFRGLCDSIIIGSLIFGLVQFFPNSMGGGDIKLMSGLGVWMGFSKTVFIIFLSFGLGALLALFLIAKRKMNRKSMMPFGPFLALGALVVWFFPDLCGKLILF